MEFFGIIFLAVGFVGCFLSGVCLLGGEADVTIPDAIEIGALALLSGFLLLSGSVILS